MHRQTSTKYAGSTQIYTDKSKASGVPSQTCSSESQSRVLKFRLPIFEKEPTIVVPGIDAQLIDKLQWLAINRPKSMKRIEDDVETMLRVHRPASPAMVINLTSQMEYRALTVNDPAVLLAPPENRIGRRIHDVLPGDLMDEVDRKLYQARATSTPSSYTFPVRHRMYQGTFYVPSGDTVLITVARLVG